VEENGIIVFIIIYMSVYILLTLLFVTKNRKSQLRHKEVQATS